MYKSLLLTVYCLLFTKTVLCNLQIRRPLLVQVFLHNNNNNNSNNNNNNNRNKTTAIKVDALGLGTGLLGQWQGLAAAGRQPASRPALKKMQSHVAQVAHERVKSDNYGSDHTTWLSLRPEIQTHWNKRLKFKQFLPFVSFSLIWCWKTKNPRCNFGLKSCKVVGITAGKLPQPFQTSWFCWNLLILWEMSEKKQKNTNEWMQINVDDFILGHSEGPWPNAVVAVYGKMYMFSCFALETKKCLMQFESKIHKSSWW